MKNKKIIIFLFLALILLPFLAVQAADTKAGGAIYVATDEIVSGNLFAAGQTITIDGTISGDLIAAAQTINVNGRIEGDLIAAAQTINVNGEIGGNIRIAGNSLSINGTVARNVNAFGNNVMIGNNAKIGWDVWLAGNTAEVRGLIEGSLGGHAGQAFVSGKIGKDVNLELSDQGLSHGLVVSPEAVINGDLIYTSKETARISDQASLGGQIEQKLPQTSEKNWFLVWLWNKLFAIFSAIVVGLVLIFLLKNVTTKILEKVTEKPAKMLVPGLILMLILPPIALLLLFTVIGIPLALIIAAWWLVAIYLAKIMTAIIVGELLIKKVLKKNNYHLFWSLALGVVICWLLFAIPFLGWILGLIAVWIGLGGIYHYAANQLRNI